MARTDQHRDTTAAHEDPGLQPKRTTLAWGRTVLAFITVAALCLRWVTHHGVFILVLFDVAVCTGTAIYLSQRVRYARSCRGIADNEVAADTVGILGLATAAITLGVLGIYVVLILTLFHRFGPPVTQARVLAAVAALTVQDMANADFTRTA